MKHYKLVEFLSNLNVKPPLHESKSPHNIKPPFWRRFCLDMTLNCIRLWGSSSSAVLQLLWNSKPFSLRPSLVLSDPEKCHGSSYGSNSHKPAE